MKTPSIKLKYDINKEVDLFLKFLHHPFFPQHRIIIFKAFPNLEIVLRNVNNKKGEKLIVQKFIKGFHKRHYKQIEKITNQAKKILSEKSKTALIELARLMDYQWPKNSLDYVAMPTILPFSPLEKEIFYFSILKHIFNKEKANIIFIAVHEISHMMLFKIMEKQYEKPFAQIIREIPLYFLKEILAPVIMNQKPLKKFLNIKIYLGNPLLHHLFVINNSEEHKQQITKFFQQLYENSKYKKQENFNQILDRMIKIILLIENDLEEKKEIWDKYGKKIDINPNIMKQYSKAIKLEKG